MRLKSTPCEGAAVDQGINVPLTPLLTRLVWLRENGKQRERDARATVAALSANTLDNRRNCRHNHMLGHENSRRRLNEPR